MRLTRLFSELKRRRVLRVAGVYAVAAWLLMQISDVIFPALRLPERR
jgi:adenylate cyclase